MMKIFSSKRILVIGCCGAGKSTFSKKLHRILKLPLIHLDAYYHKPNWEEPKKEDWEKKVKKLVRRPEWIIDGNYADSFDVRMPRSDTIIYLDYSSAICCWRVIKRVITDYGKKRSDMAKGCKEEFDLSFLKFVLKFNYNNRKSIYDRLEKLKETKNIIVLRKDKEVDLFLSQLRQNYIP